MHKFFSVVFFAIFSLCITPFSLFSDPLITDEDFEAIRDFVGSKKVIAISQKEGNLSIYGDTRASYAFRHQKQEITPGQFFNWGSSPLATETHGGKGASLFQLMFNLGARYRADASYACAELRFKDRMGLDSDANARGNGESSKISLRKAYLGYYFIDNGIIQLRTQLGRNKLEDFYESYIQFDSQCDGVTALLYGQFEAIFDLEAATGVYVINNMSNFYFYVAELVFRNIAGSGVYIGANFIDWYQKKPTFPSGFIETNPRQKWNTITNDPRYKFRNIAFFLGWKTPESIFKVPIEVYSGVVINTAAERRANTAYLKANKGYYIGTQWGSIRKKGDWSLDLRYELVQAQAIPQWDISGIGQGNLKGYGLYFNTNNPPTEITDPALAHGTGNYRGWTGKGIYAFTNSLSGSLSYAYSNAATRRIGGQNRWRKLELEFIYSF